MKCPISFKSHGLKSYDNYLLAEQRLFMQLSCFRA